MSPESVVTHSSRKHCGKGVNWRLCLLSESEREGHVHIIFHSAFRVRGLTCADGTTTKRRFHAAPFTILTRNLPPLPSRLYRGCVPVCPDLPPPPPLCAWYLMFTPQVASLERRRSCLPCDGDRFAVCRRDGHDSSAEIHIPFASGRPARSLGAHGRHQPHVYAVGRAARLRMVIFGRSLSRALLPAACWRTAARVALSLARCGAPHERGCGAHPWPWSATKAR